MEIINGNLQVLSLDEIDEVSGAYSNAIWGVAVAWGSAIGTAFYTGYQTGYAIGVQVWGPIPTN